MVMKLNSFILICIFWVLNISSFTEGSQEIYFREHQSDLLNSLTHTNENSIKSNDRDALDQESIAIFQIYERVKIPCSATKCCRMPRLCVDNGTMCKYRGIKIPAFLC